MGEGIGWLILLILAYAFFWWAGEQSEKDQMKIADLTAKLCVATEDADFFICHAKCSELNAPQVRRCLDTYAELLANAGSNPTK
ncbi:MULTISPECIES: hypothetical protein [Pseudomonadota]|uniref:hypothetical protein n=1 Tax=Pseudomonadota TaxID=1224 RepID=UPI002635062C|nr:MULTISPECIES: hypothetical protein [Pseudomonadota]